MGRTAELLKLLVTARKSTREPDDRHVPQPGALHRSVVDCIVRNYQTGASTHDLALRYNVRRGTVRDGLRREGLNPSERSHRSNFTPEIKVELRERFAGGATKRELAEAYGVSTSTISRMLRA